MRSEHQFKASVAETGTSDAALDPIITALTGLGKKLRKQATANRSDKDTPQEAVNIEAELEAELKSLLGTDKKIEDWINPLLGMPTVDIHQDTPTEILHTVLLGVVKYFWAQSILILQQQKKIDEFQARLQSISTSGLLDPDLRAEYICQYSGSLIGKHFKSIAQVMPFLVYDLVSSTVLDAWTTIGSLVVLLWHTDIQNTESYLSELSRCIEDFLSLTAKCAPSILISKPKFHFLVHLPAYIRRFGPPILFSTERYESFNWVFRLASIFSNRQAPSRDICRSFAYQDIVKHIATGGFWLDGETKQWVCAKRVITDYIHTHPAQAQLLGLEPPKAVDVGTFIFLIFCIVLTRF